MKKTVAIIGGGPSALLLAAFLDTSRYDVTIYEKNKSLGRKFLVAGKGGFNLTHAEPLEKLMTRYFPIDFLDKALKSFTNTDFIEWSEKIGIPTFIGTSKRVFPQKGIKPIEVLNAIISVLRDNNVNILFSHIWKGWDKKNALIFDSGHVVKSDFVVFALGGGSWKVTGSDGSWLDIFTAKGIKTLPFRSSNCAFKIEWPKAFISKSEGKPLKNISISCENKTQKGEVVLTQFGLEGNAIYALSQQIQDQLLQDNKAIIYMDLKPMLSLEEIVNRLTTSQHLNTTDILRAKIKLSNTQIHLIKNFLTKEEFINHQILSQRIKNLPLTIVGAASVDEAISTTGGINLQEVNSSFELINLKNHFCIGEMLDWNAPTGGYLLQACFSMGVYLAHYLNSLVPENE